MCLDRLFRFFFGPWYIGDYQHEGWIAPLPHYKFICPKHGPQTGYAQGYDKRVECPECRKEGSRFALKVKEELKH